MTGIHRCMGCYYKEIASGDQQRVAGDRVTLIPIDVAAKIAAANPPRSAE